MVVYICCAGGATSSLLCKKIKDASEDRLNIYFDSVKNIISDLKNSKLNEYDIILGYGPSGTITKHFINEYNIDNFFDLILISPQVRFDAKRIQELMTPYDVPTEVIEMKTFGTMNGSKVLDHILEFDK